MTSRHGYMSDVTRTVYGDAAKRLDGEVITHDYGVVLFSQGSTSQLELYPAEFPAEQRSGLLTLPSVLAIGAYPVHPAPVLRGKRILERVETPGGAPPVAFE